MSTITQHPTKRKPDPRTTDTGATRTPDITDFRSAVEQSGIGWPTNLEPGRYNRVHGVGKTNGNTSGWVFLFEDGLGGAYGDWATDLSKTWQAARRKKLSQAEQAAQTRRSKELHRVRAEEERLRHEEAAQRAQEICDGASPAPHDHPYLIKKGIQPHDLRIDDENQLIIPVMVNGAISSMQFINEHGSKKFLFGGDVQGGAYTIGNLTESTTVLLGEGFATCASLHEDTGFPVACAFSANNLTAVATQLRQQFPAAIIVICGDHDVSGTGQREARKAAEAVGGLIALPEVEGTDFNDLHLQQGLDAVKEAIAAAMSDTQKAEPAPSVYTPLGNAAQLHTPPALAHKPNILAEFSEAIRLCGVVGEERCAQLVYLAVTSRILVKPISVGIKGLTSSGKSFTTETTLNFFPEDAYIALTGLSEKALIYMKEDFAHKTIVLYEASALREQKEKTEGDQTAYFLRTLLSEGRISYSVTIRDKEEGFVTKTFKKDGPTNLVLTTTATTLHGENETRMLSIPTNDTNDQTRAIMQRLAGGPVQDPDFTGWHALQHWLEKAETRVTIPYAAYLAETIPPVAVRLRRDFGALLQLIGVHAILHQCTREKDSEGRIVATDSDYLAVRALVADLLAAGVGSTVSDVVRETVEAVKSVSLANPADEGVTVQKLADHLKLDRSAVQRRVQAAREKGFVVNLEDKRGRAARYALGEPLPEQKDLLPSTVPGPGCTHTHTKGDGDAHSVSASDHETIIEGVQLCSERAGVKTDDEFLDPEDPL